MVRVLFVCLGNICRSPMAEGVYRALVPAAEVDSAGTGGWHVGNPPDPRAVAMAGAHGIDISAQRARQVGAADFAAFDLIVAMDGATLAALRRLDPGGGAEVRQLAEADVPDPYYDGRFAEAFAVIEAGCRQLAGH